MAFSRMRDGARLNCDARKRPRSTAAHDAASEGNIQRLHALFDAGCDVDLSDKNQVTPLLSAAKEGHVECVRFLLQCGANVNQKGKFGRGRTGWTVAHYAAVQGNMEMLLLSLDASCDTEVTNSDGDTPLMCAAERGHTACVQLLLQRGATARIRTRSGYTPVRHAAERGDKEMLLALLDAGCEVDTADCCGYTPLMRAVVSGHTDCVQLFLQRGANVHVKNSYECESTLAHLAAGLGKKEMLLALLGAGCEVDATDRYGDTPLTYAAKRGHTDCVRLLLQRGADGMGRPCTHYAAEAGHKETLLALLDAGCGVDATDRQDRTPLACAVQRGHADCVRLLLQRGAKEDGWTLAHSAALQGDKEVLQTLLDAGLDVEASDERGETPLMCAARGGNVDCVRLLLQRRADVHKKATSGGTPAHHAAERGDKEMLLALLDAGCEVDTADCCGYTPLMRAVVFGHTDCAKLLLQRGADVHAEAKGGSLAHCAAWQGNKEMLLAVLDAGCNVNSAKKIDHSLGVDHSSGETPLMVAAERGHRDCVQLLLQRGANARASTYFGRTVAHCAAECGDKETLLAVLDAGCPVDAEDDEGMTPLLFAAKGGHEDCMELLLQRGANPGHRLEGLEGEPDVINFAAKSSAGALRVVLASLVQLPFLEHLFDDCYQSGSDPISLALACGCHAWMPECWMESSLSSGNDFGGQDSFLPVKLGCSSLPYAL